MKRFMRIVNKTSGVLDRLAGLCFFMVMFLIVLNIILRVVFKSPILGTYEIVGFLSALGIGLALAQCAVKNGHIAVDLIFQKFSEKIRSGLSIMNNLVAILFWSGTICSLIKLGQNMFLKGMISPTAEIPLYPFIYLIALGLFGLCLVLLQNLILEFQKALSSISLHSITPGFKAWQTAKR